ncbi:MAG: cysteine hydrolase [Treponema sp.]|nr:cysteine hydrolase [Treponema sp.]
MENKKALLVIDLQNDITKNYKDIISNVNSAIDWALEEGMQVVYIKHHNKIPFIRAFIEGTKGAELVPELKIVSDNIFAKEKGNALTSKDFAAFIKSNDISEFYIAGADATACVKATCVNMKKSSYSVNVISDCVTSYNLKKLDKMLSYYKKKGCEVKKLKEYMAGKNDC